MILFLDVQVERHHNELHTSVFQKKTHTDRCIHFDSHNHLRILNGVIKCLHKWAEQIYHPSRMNQEQDHLIQVFRANVFLSRLLRMHWLTPVNTSQMQPHNNLQLKMMDKRHRYGSQWKIEQVCHSSVKSSDKHTHSNGPLRTGYQRRGRTWYISEVPCRGTVNRYTLVRLTDPCRRGWLNTRWQLISRADQNNGFAVHVWSSGHRINWDEAKIKATVSYYSERRAMEASILNSTEPGLWTLHKAIWKPLILTLTHSLSQQYTHRTFPTFIFHASCITYDTSSWLPHPDTST